MNSPQPLEQNKLFKASKKYYNQPMQSLFNVSNMSVTLPKAAEQFIESEVAAGHVGSADDVIMEALELYQLRREYIEEQLLQGLEDANAGRLREYSPQMLEDIKHSALKKMALRLSEQ